MNYVVLMLSVGMALMCSVQPGYSFVIFSTLHDKIVTM